MAPRATEAPGASSQDDSGDGRLTAGFAKYPARRDAAVKSASNWLMGKRLDDDCGELWRVHDTLYDLSDFERRHPGGADWIGATRGTDITEAFESSHLSPDAAKILAKYAVRPASGRRNSPYTFQPDGFYMTLKRRAFQRLRDADPAAVRSMRRRVRAVQDALLAVLAAGFLATAYWQSTLLAALTGVVLFANINCAHNFYHQRDSWRMYCWDLGLLSSHEWRVTHSLSHHVYTNSIYDYELSGFEPFFDFKVHTAKSVVQRRGLVVLGHLIYPLFFVSDLLKRVYLVTSGQQRLRPENLLPLAQLALLVAGVGDAATGLKLWSVIQFSASYWFGLIGVVAAHHHPELFHAGDDHLLGTDWGLCQLDATRDRRDVNGRLLFELTTYGNHVLHHLFPTCDHGVLPLLQQDLVDVCRQFGLPDADHFQQSYTQRDLFVGALRQLDRVTPRSPTVKSHQQ